MVVSDEDEEYDDNYDEEGRLDDNLLRKIGILCRGAKSMKALSKG